MGVEYRRNPISRHALVSGFVVGPVGVVRAVELANALPFSVVQQSAGLGRSRQNFLRNLTSTILEQAQIGERSRLFGISECWGIMGRGLWFEATP